MSRIPLTERYPGVAALPRVGLVDGADPDRHLGRCRDDVHASAGCGSSATTSRRRSTAATRCASSSSFSVRRSPRQRAVLTFGAYGSNHALATAVHARALGLEPHVVLSPQAPGPFARAHAAGARGARHGAAPDRRLGRPARGGRGEAALAERDGIEPASSRWAARTRWARSATSTPRSRCSRRADATRRRLRRGRHARHRDRPRGRLRGRGRHTRWSPCASRPSEVGSDAIAQRLSRRDDRAACARSTRASPTWPRRPAFELRHDWFEPGLRRRHARDHRGGRAGRCAPASSSRPPTPARRSRRLGDARGGGSIRANHVLFWDTYNSGRCRPGVRRRAAPGASGLRRRVRQAVRAGVADERAVGFRGMLPMREAESQRSGAGTDDEQRHDEQRRPFTRSSSPCSTRRRPFDPFHTRWSAALDELRDVRTRVRR